MKTLVLVAFVGVVLPAAACATPVPANPGGCNTAAHDPHPSTHVPGTISAEVRQDCPNAVEQNSTEAQMWEHRFWGFDRIGDPAFSPLRTTRTSSAVAAVACRTNEMRVTGYGHYLWAGQHIQSAEVMNTKNVSC